MSKLLSIADLTQQLNFDADTAEVQTDDSLRELHVYITKMYMKYCGKVPKFILDAKGRVELK